MKTVPQTNQLLKTQARFKRHVARFQTRLINLGMLSHLRYSLKCMLEENIGEMEHTKANQVDICEDYFAKILFAHEYLSTL